MNTRSPTGTKDLDSYLSMMNRFSNYMISRPADGAVDASHNLMMGIGKSRPYETHGMLPVDAESVLFNRGTVLGKSGHTVQSFGSTVMQTAGEDQSVPTYSIPRLDYSARDSKSAPMPTHPGMPVVDIQPVPTITQSSGLSSRQYIRSQFAQQ